MAFAHNPIPGHDTVTREANTGRPSIEVYEKMARRRHQNPRPEIHGDWWTIRLWKDTFINGEHQRIKDRVRVAPVIQQNGKPTPMLTVKKRVDEILGPLNQGLETIGSATNFGQYVECTYIPTALVTMASSTRDRYRGVISNYLVPAFGNWCWRDMTPVSLDRYFAGLVNTDLSQESLDKVRDVLASIIKRAIRHGLLVKNPLDGMQLPLARKRRKRSQPYVTPEQFNSLLANIPEPYATMVYVAIYTGLRISELAGLRWNDIHQDSITIDERYCRGDWGAPKSEASNATIAVNRCVIERIHHLKLLTVEVRAGRAVRKYRVVKSDGPDDLVFQSVKDGRPIRDNNILTRFLKPAGRTLGMPWLNWRCLRTSHATWLKLVGADVKDAQAQMRHSRAGTTLDYYQQFVAESQKRVVERLSTLSQFVN
jgi:integrase